MSQSVFSARDVWKIPQTEVESYLSSPQPMAHSLWSEDGPEKEYTDQLFEKYSCNPLAVVIASVALVVATVVVVGAVVVDTVVVVATVVVGGVQLGLNVPKARYEKGSLSRMKPFDSN